MMKALAIAVGLALVATAALGGSNPANKIAIHTKAHPTSCVTSYPGFSSCTDIEFVWTGVGDVDVMPVFFDLAAYTMTEFGLSWPPAWGSIGWVRCRGDYAVGSIIYTGDGTAITWGACQQGWSAAPGYGWLTATGAGMVCPIPNPATGDYGVADCAASPGPHYDYPLVVSCAGISGMIGDDPCRWVNGGLSSWGAIKTIFK